MRIHFIAQSITTVLVLTTTARAGAQVPKFPIADSPIQLTGDIRPGQYIGVVGRKAAWLGQETGGAELWIHPLKLASEFQLDFQIPDYITAVRGVDVARTIDVRPELTTITYSHATFTVKQHILAPLNTPGILILLDVETFRSLEIVVSFKTVFQYAWPGAFGGQNAGWNNDQKYFVLSESLRERNAIIGSPWAGDASSHPAHALPDAPSTFRIPVDRVRAQTEFIPIAVAAGIAPRDSVIATYRELIDSAESLYLEKRTHVTNLLTTTTALDTPDDELDLAFAWSKINMDEQVVCNPDLGCGLVAGWGPSGKGTRPGFGWFFGGDAAITSFAMDATGQWDDVAQALRFLASYQRADGKITHEISQSAGRIPWFTDYPYGYYHADTTPYWIVAVWRYWRATGDDELVQELWPAIEKAFAWCLTVETDGDGIIENTTGGLGAIEVGAIGAEIHQDIYLAAVWITSLSAISEMSSVVGGTELKMQADRLLTTASRSLNDDYWRDEEGHHAFGILRSGETNNNLTVWPATAAAFGLLDSARAVLTLQKLGSDGISSDWGARMLSTESPLYGPMEYNSGAVWPFVTGFVSWGQYNYQRPWAGYQLISALKQMTFDWARGRHPELLSGSFYRPLDTAVPHQFFATAMLISPVVTGMLGWDPNAPAGRARLRPQLPPEWRTATVHNLRVGGSSIRADFIQSDRSLTVTLEGTGPEVEIEVIAPLPPGASADDSLVRAVRVTDSPTTIHMAWSGGLRVQIPPSTLEPGQTSTGLRVIDFRYQDGEWELDVEGVGGMPYEIHLHGEAVRPVDGIARSYRTGTVTTLVIAFDGNGRSRKSVVLRR